MLYLDQTYLSRRSSNLHDRSTMADFVPDQLKRLASTPETLAVVGVVLLVVLLSTKLLFRSKQLNLPPGPPSLPIIGSLHLLGTHPHQTLAAMAKKYGPVMSVRFGQRLCIVATSADAAREFLKRQDANFASRPSLRCIELIQPVDINFHDITPELRHLRKILVSELTSAKRLEASKFVRSDEVAYMIATIAKTETPIRVKRHLEIMSTNILSRMILSKRFLGGEDSSSEVQEFIDVVEEATQCFGAFHPQDFFDCVPSWLDFGLDKRFRKCRARMDAFYFNMVDQHKENRRKFPVSEAEKTLLDVLLEQLGDNGVTDEHIKGVVWDGLAAGIHTTMASSEWALAEVLRNPFVLSEAKAELDQVIGFTRTVQESDIPNLKYIQAIVKESLRLHPPLPFLLPHQSINATTAFGYDIPAKTRLFVNIWGIGRDPEVWKKTSEFAPERFLEGANAGTEFQGQHFELIPFGAGRRLCPGTAFASTVVHLQVASLLHAFDWSFLNGMAAEELDMREGRALTLERQCPLEALAVPRLPSHLYHQKF